MLFYLQYYIYDAWKDIAREAYLESLQRYMMELFCERGNDFKSYPVFAKTIYFIIDVWHGSKYASELQR